MKTKILITGLLIMVFGLVVTSVYAHSPEYYNNKDVMTDVKKIDKGVQITFTSNDSNTARDIQENIDWYENAFERWCFDCRDNHSKNWQSGNQCGCPRC